uniref:EF-hand domain-containing protein n=1 Tax=Rhizophora mucronata TaxID=61149 RepID=A0A2P2LNP1_RHIMU
MQKIDSPDSHVMQVNLISFPRGLGFQETRDLWTQADVDGNGIVDYEEFKRIWDSAWTGQTEENCAVRMEDFEQETKEGAIGLTVKNAVLCPPEAEKGMWPENYSLSDHARLTVVFSPVRMLCS